MENRQQANAKSNPAAGCDWFCDNAGLVRRGGIHKNLSPFWLRSFLTQEKIFRNAPNANF